MIRADLRDHVTYEPIEPIEVLAERLGVPPERIVKLDGNENLYGPSPRVAEALAHHDGYHIYPDPDQRRVREALAAYTGVPAEHIVAGAGSDELIDLIGRALLSPGDAVIDLVPTFGMYSFTASVCGARIVNAPRRPDFSVDTVAVARATEERTKIVFAASPNNPSGNRLSRAELDRLLALPLLVVVDEAYVEFSGGSYASLVPERENLVVLRTFSKWAGLAGVRAGYGLMAPELAQTLMAIKPPYNVNVPAEVAMLASLEDQEALEARVRRIVEERDRLAVLLAGVPYLEPWPSEANFILCRVTRGSARDLRGRLRERGIFLRYFGRAGLEDCIRISVGRPEHTDALMAALGEVEP
ncbi:MAG: histidinol-phosphate transaminase [Dehalococcoidia bacterium]